MEKAFNFVLIYLFIFSLGSTSYAKKATRKPSQVNKEIAMKVVYGEKTTFFNVLPKSDKVIQLYFANNEGRKGDRSLSQADYDFIKGKILDIKGPSNKKEFCSRSFIEIRLEDKLFVGCIGSNNKVAKTLQEISDLFVLLF
jgi:hypothetical protein